MLPVNCNESHRDNSNYKETSRTRSSCGGSRRWFGVPRALQKTASGMLAAARVGRPCMDEDSPPVVTHSTAQRRRARTSRTHSRGHGGSVIAQSWWTNIERTRLVGRNWRRLQGVTLRAIVGPRSPPMSRWLQVKVRCRAWLARPAGAALFILVE